MAFKIITDSSCNLPNDILEKYDIDVIALEFIIEGKSYRSYIKDEVIKTEKFYKMMIEGKTITTSQPSNEEIEKYADIVFGNGHDMLYLGFDSSLSATFENTSHVLENIRAKKYPERKLISVDTFAAALGQGMLVVAVAEYAKTGKTLEETAKWTEDNKYKMQHLITVDDLSYLQRGGRLSRGGALVGSLLKIKPTLVLTTDGKIVADGKERGRKKAIESLSEKMQGLWDDKNPLNDTIYISHADCIDDVNYLVGTIKVWNSKFKFQINQLDPVIGAHTGPGCIALFFWSKTNRSVK